MTTHAAETARITATRIHALATEAGAPLDVQRQLWRLATMPEADCAARLEKLTDTTCAMVDDLVERSCPDGDDPTDDQWSAWERETTTYLTTTSPGLGLWLTEPAEHAAA